MALTLKVEIGCSSCPVKWDETLYHFELYSPDVERLVQKWTGMGWRHTIANQPLCPTCAKKQKTLEDEDDAD